jgi:alkyl sulfatase BDS1-like metallo-beta-lactamase superfamily hydrolase
VSAFATDDGLVLVDTSNQVLAGHVHDVVRGWDARSVSTVVFTHGHIDHCFGVEHYEADNQALGAAPPRVIAHEAVPARFDRYRATAGYNETINRRQFSMPGFEWPRDFRYPDETYQRELMLNVGGERFELHHARGETDDHTWVWVPERRVLCTGDLFIWASPNCGNPQKVQRYAKDWVTALRVMAELDAATMLPGHGLPIIGADRVREALLDTAALLEHLHDEVLTMMNEGSTLDEIIHTVRAPAALLEKPYLRPVYDEPEFVVRNVWRLYGGWWDGTPSRLKPAADAVVGREVAALAGGVEALAARARAVADAGDLRLAAHLADWAVLAAPDDAAAHRVRAEVYERRLQAETSTMTKEIFRWTATQSREQSENEPE